MQETRTSISSEDRSSIIAAFFLGVATILFIVMYWISFPNILVFSFVSLATLVIFLTIAILLAQPRSTKKVVHVSKIAEPKKEVIKDRNYIGSTKTQVYHKSSCGLAKAIKPEFKASSDDKSFFKKYKSCERCLKE